MASHEQDIRELRTFLQQRGHSESEIEKVVEKLGQHDSDVLRQSVFDSIAAGSFDLEAIIKEALEGDEP